MCEIGLTSPTCLIHYVSVRSSFLLPATVASIGRHSISISATARFRPQILALSQFSHAVFPLMLRVDGRPAIDPRRLIIKMELRVWAENSQVAGSCMIAGDNAAGPVGVG